MGRQIRFYMLPEDRNAFLRFVQERDPVVVIARDSDSAEIQPTVDLDIGPGKTLCLWNRKFLPHLKREWIADPGYYRADGFGMPILDFTSSFRAIWEGSGARSRSTLRNLRGEIPGLPEMVREPNTVDTEELPKEFKRY